MGSHDAGVDGLPEARGSTPAGGVQVDKGVVLGESQKPGLPSQAGCHCHRGGLSVFF